MGEYYCRAAPSVEGATRTHRSRCGYLLQGLSLREIPRTRNGPGLPPHDVAKGAIVSEKGAEVPGVWMASPPYRATRLYFPGARTGGRSAAAPPVRGAEASEAEPLSRSTLPTGLTPS